MFVQAVKVRNLHNIFPEHFELQFYQAFHALKRLGCDYLYFLGLDEGISYRFCTHEHWLDFYHDEKFIQSDPLKRIAENTKFIALPWSQITYSHMKEKKTMSGRNSFGLFNGLTIAREYQQRKYIFALSTELKEHDLARFLLLENKDILQIFIQDCMKLFNEYLLLMRPYSQEMLYIN